jgi:hypothetical protein
MSTAAASADSAAPTLDLQRLGAELERLLRLRSHPFGMKLFETEEAMAAIDAVIADN